MAAAEKPRPSPRDGESPPSTTLVAEPTPRPSDPLIEKWNAIWSAFQSADEQTREAIFLRNLDDRELFNDEAALIMLERLRENALARGDRQWFGRLLDAVAERRPDLYEESSYYYLSWQLEDALVDDRPEVPTLTRALAALAGRQIDVVNRSLETLAYHGRLDLLVEAMRIGWPLVRDSDDITGWGIGEFAELGVAYEMYAYLERTPSPDPSASELLERVRYFVEDPRLEFVTDFIGDVSGQSNRGWTVADFTLQAPKKSHRRNRWDDDDDDDAEKPIERGSRNLYHLVTQFVGYLRRHEGMPYPRAELIRRELHSYFIRRHEGDLNPRLSMLEQALEPKKRLPLPPRPSHPLCPDRVTFEVCVAKMFGMISAHHHKAAAMFEVVPAWLRFLQSKQLISDEQLARTLNEMQPMKADLLKVMEHYKEDPTLFRSLSQWRSAP